MVGGNGWSVINRRYPDGSEYDLENKFQSVFFDEIEQILRKKIYSFASNVQISSYLEKRLILIRFPEISRACYALEFKQTDEISFRFDSPGPLENSERMKQAMTRLDAWQEQLGFPICAEKWGQKRSRLGYFFKSSDKDHVLVRRDLGGTLIEEIPNLDDSNIFHVALKNSLKLFPGAPFWQIKAMAYADIAERFIQITSLDLLTMFGNLGYSSQPRATQRVSTSENRPFDTSHKLLEKKIYEILDFLAGHADRTIKPEELCDWIQFCYQFDLPTEGQKLFGLIEPQALNNDWLYRRTKRYADLCRLKAPIKG